MAALVACGTRTEDRVTRRTAVEHGRAIYLDPRASPSTVNRFACVTCHVAEPRDDDGKLRPGAPLAGVLARPTYWHGQEDDALRAINACRIYFMGAQEPWSRGDEEAKALYAYLSGLPASGPPVAVPFTVVESAVDLPAGDRARGKVVFDTACSSCHGAKRTGEGRLTERAPKLPEQTLAEHTYLSPTDRRVVFVEKVRHGVFLGYSGTMPPFSREVMSDADLSALLAYLDLY